MCWCISSFRLFLDTVPPRSTDVKYSAVFINSDKMEVDISHLDSWTAAALSASVGPALVKIAI